MTPSPFRFRKSYQKDSLRPKKSLGQNFLVDRNVIGRMIDACSLSGDEVVVEIGPGTGALTREIAPRVKRLIAIETDGSLVERLRDEFKEQNVEIIHADFLRCDLSEILGKAKVKVVGNLPYYISTPIMTKVIENRHLFAEFYLTVQQEFAERIVASPGGKDYSSFSCFNQFYTVPQILFKIKSSAFKPAPKVDSCFLKLTMCQMPAYPCDDEKFLFHVIRLGFQQRRKTLVNALSTLLPKEQLIVLFPSIGLLLNVRAEDVSLEQYVLLAERLLLRGGESV
jgi:16S rRNA (adenine1518-N6/adenine1519-N6)-dimethyltransferase